GIDVESKRVAFLAPGGASFEHGAVSHLHLDHVVVGMRIGLHGIQSFVLGAGSDRPGNIGKGARLIAFTRKCNYGCTVVCCGQAGGSAIMAVKLTSQVTFPSTLALPQNLHTRARFWMKPTLRSSRQPGSTGERNFASSIAMK